MQYFTHLPALLVGVHLFGACVVWCAALWFTDGLRSHVPEDGALSVPPGPDRDGTVVKPEAVAL